MSQVVLLVTKLFCSGAVASKRSESLQSDGPAPWIVTVLLLLLCGCVPQLSQLTQLNRPAVFAPKATEPENQLLEYLAAADEALARDHLTKPLRNSAFELYRGALVLDPENPHARRGLSMICRRYLALANAALSEGEYKRARRYLERLLRVDPQNPDAIALRQALAQQEQLVLAGAALKELSLPVEALSSRDPALVLELQKLAAQLARQRERIVIYARTDAEARWVYQQLKQAQPQLYLSVTTGLSPRPRIVVVPIPHPNMPVAMAQ